ncbi:hypothetical protein MHSWG343_08190 [Candidatus Mycoplasma haematohominis]|uniref:Uncharacterized protein n=1 Tax=Candidatus Mycoplasma haematohominis TaxID=1494318 RepID=A0A478FQY7_9MOLU|nr:hypothetical protein MHSWG343_08190 [Candidatus Mycoplasma haemohominis]
MAIPAKSVAVGTALTVTVGGSAAIGAKYLLSESIEDFVSLKSSDHANKYASDYWKYFLSNEEGKNSKGWEKLFKKLSDDKKVTENPRTVGNKFNSLSDVDALKNACVVAYGSDKNNVVTSSPTDSQYSEEDVWRYCSAVNRKPTAAGVFPKEGGTGGQKESEGYPENSFGRQNKDQLVSITDPENALFWNVQGKWFFKKEDNGSDRTFSGNGSSIFKKLYDSGKGSLKDVCEEGYKLTSANANNKVDETDLFKYCSLKGSKTT